MGQVTHNHAELLLRLYELRREPRLREARSWFMANFNAKSAEEMNQKYPSGSEGNVNVRMVISYWEMAASLSNHGLIDDELFFENAGEAWFVWDRVREIVPQMRAAFKNPHVWGQLESMAKRMEQWQERRAPGSPAAMRQMFNASHAATPNAQ